jgi:hypothetical protein
MLNVFVRGRIGDLTALQSASVKRQYAFHFLGYATTGAIKLQFVESPDVPAFHANREEGVKISVFRSDEISGYIGVSRGDYLLLLSMLGLVQYHALVRNPLFREEDFLHGEPGNCLFSYRATLTEYIQLLEKPEICPYCKHFYGALCDTGILAALDAEVTWCQTSIRHLWNVLKR